LTHHDRVIASKFDLDRELDKIVCKNGQRLIRITDRCYRYRRDEMTEKVADLVGDNTWTGVKYIGELFESAGVIL